MNRRAIGLITHTVLILFVHLIINAALRKAELWPEPIDQWRSWLLEGKVGYYHEPSGLCFITIWMIIYFIDAADFLFRDKTKETRHAKTKSKSTVLLDDKEKRFPSQVSAKQAASGQTSINRAWSYLLIGGALEIVWAALLKINWLGGPLLLIFVLSFHCLMKAAKTLPAGTVYAVFTGIGVAGTSILDIAAFGEKLDFTRLGFIALLLFFIILLKRSSHPAGKGG